MKTTSTDLTFETSLQKLINRYSKGIPNTRCWERPAAAMSSGDIKVILNSAGNNIDDFKTFMLSNHKVEDLFIKNNLALIKTWFTRLTAAKKHIDKETAKRESKRIARLVIIANIKKDDATRKAKLLKKQEMLKKQAKKKEVLWKQLNLSADQKKILRSLAQ